MILDLFAGPGGWSEGLRALGRDDELGIEWGDDECSTRAAAGHASLRADVAALDPLDARFVGAEGIIASPPCPAFSTAGKREGMVDMDRLTEHAGRCDAAGWFPIEGPWEHPESPLVLEPLRWAYLLRPTWIACEQVPPVLPAWRATAHALRAWGYRTWTGLLNAADYGVPQTRRRAILMAHLSSRVVPPAPTHTRDPAPSLFGLPRWITMAEALGWGNGRIKTGNHSQKGGGVLEDYSRSVDEPAPTIDCGAGGKWTREGDEEPWAYLTRPRGSGYIERHGDRRAHPDNEPAPAITGHSKDFAVVLDPDYRPWGDLSTEEMAAAADGSWVQMRPATTIAGDSRLFAPGGHHEPGSQSRYARHLTIPEAAVLQSFRADYPFQGSRTSQFRQVGNAVPPRLAQAILAQLLG